jgi:zinc transporter ZupT
VPVAQRRAAPGRPPPEAPRRSASRSRSVTLVQPLLPWGLAFAAGAMIFVISGEIIPETHRKGVKIEGTFGLMTGFVVMMILDTTLG